MTIKSLNIIGESINDSVPSTHNFYDTEDWNGIRGLALSQQDGGAAYLDVNVGGRGAEMMIKAVKTVQESSSLPISVDSPDPILAEAGLKVYDAARGKPILNSISPLRTEMFDLYKITPFRPILLISEFINSNGEEGPARTAEETYDAALDLFQKAKTAGIPNEDMIFDPGIAPIGSDYEDNLKRLLDTLKMIQQNPEMSGVHASVGLSNFTVMLPLKTKGGLAVKSTLESAFLTVALPLGLDYVVGSVKRKYEILNDDHPAMLCLNDCLAAGGFESLARVRQFYSN